MKYLLPLLILLCFSVVPGQTPDQNEVIKQLTKQVEALEKKLEAGNQDLAKLLEQERAVRGSRSGFQEYVDPYPDYFPLYFPRYYPRYRTVRPYRYYLHFPRYYPRRIY